jgi:hypothetical protein
MNYKRHFVDVESEMKTLEWLTPIQIQAVIENDLKCFQGYGTSGAHHTELSKYEKSSNFVTSHAYPVDHVYVHEDTHSHVLISCDLNHVCRLIKGKVWSIKHPELTATDVLRFRVTADGKNFKMIGPVEALTKAVEYEVQTIRKGIELKGVVLPAMEIMVKLRNSKGLTTHMILLHYD